MRRLFKFTRAISTIMAIAMVISCTVFSISAEDGVPAWAENAVATWRTNGWLDSGTFTNDAVSRGEFVKWLCGAFGIYDAEPDYSKSALITRQDIAIIIGRAEESEANLPSADLSLLDNFNNKGEISGYAMNHVARCVGLGYLGGYDDGTVRPKNNMTRAEAIVMLS